MSDGEEEALVTGSNRRRASLADRNLKRRHTLDDSSDEEEGLFDDDADDTGDGVAQTETTQNVVYSADRMKEALATLESFLTPTPNETESHETFNDVVAKKYRFDDEDKVMELRGILDDVEIEVTMEYKCLVVEAARQAFLSKDAKVSKKIFFKGKGLSQGEPIGQIVTGKWLSHSLSKLQRMPSTADIQPENVHVTLLGTIMQFILDCFVIDTAKKLQTLKTKYDLDWEKSASDVYNFAESRQVEALTGASLKTRDYLKKVKSDDAAAVAATAAAATAPISASVPDKSKEDEERIKKEKSEERKRKMREQQLARFGGKPVASSAAVPAPAPVPTSRPYTPSVRPTPPAPAPPVPHPSVPLAAGRASGTISARAPAVSNDWGDSEPKSGNMDVQDFEAKFSSTRNEQKEVWDNRNAGDQPSSNAAAASDRKWADTDTELYNRDRRQNGQANDYNSSNYAQQDRNWGSQNDPTPQDRSWASNNSDRSRPQSASYRSEPPPQDRPWTSETDRSRPQNAGYRSEPPPPARNWGSETDRSRPQNASYRTEPAASENRYSSYSSQAPSYGVASNTDSADARNGNRRLDYNDVSSSSTFIDRTGRDNQTDAGRSMDNQGAYGTKRPQDDFSSGPAYDRGNKRSRFQDADRRPPVSQGLPSDDSGGAGRGRGRGRTLPAWVTQSQQADSLGADRSVDNDAPARNMPPQDSRRSRESFPPPSTEVAFGGGRGRARTMPAWMSQPQQPSGHTSSYSSQDGRPAAMDNQGGGRGRNSGAGQYGGPPPMDDIGGGRGRGRGMTLPAWMTQS